MNTFAKAPVATHATASDAHPSASDAPSAHPKIARRPSQWKHAQPTVANETAAPSVAAPTKHEAATPWQEDTRFGAFLLVFILLLNAALLSFDQKAAPKAEPSLMIQQVTRASALPDAHARDYPSVRLFANPDETLSILDDDGFERVDE